MNKWMNFKIQLKQNRKIERWTCYLRPFVEREKTAKTQHYIVWNNTQEANPFSKERKKCRENV